MRPDDPDFDPLQAMHQAVLEEKLQAMRLHAYKDALKREDEHVNVQEWKTLRRALERVFTRQRDAC